MAIAVVTHSRGQSDCISVVVVVSVVAVALVAGCGCC